MDRRHPEKLPAIQLSFIQHLVSPLFQACAKAGIIPGILENVAPDTGGNSPTQTLDLLNSGLDILGERANKSDGETEAAIISFFGCVTLLHCDMPD